MNILEIVAPYTAEKIIKRAGKRETYNLTFISLMRKISEAIRPGSFQLEDHGSGSLSQQLGLYHRREKLANLYLICKQSEKTKFMLPTILCSNHIF